MPKIVKEEDQFEEAKKHIACTSCRQRKLKCNGVQPCEHCTRLQRECVYSTVVLKSGPRKGFLKQIESRLDILETQSQSPSAPAFDMASFDPAALSHDQVLALIHRLQQVNPVGQIAGTSSPVSSSGLNASPPVPQQEHFSHDVFTEMWQHKPQDVDPSFVFVAPKTYRELLVPGNPHHHLRYALALMACVDPAWAHLEAECYRRALAHLQHVEASAQQPDVAYLQALIAVWLYEQHRCRFRESWTTAGKATRTAVAMGLHLLDSDPKVHGDLSEQRRVFWAVFTIDRYQIMATSWPKVFALEQVTTKFPVSTDSFLSDYSEPAFNFTTCIEDHDMFGMHHFVDDVYCFTLIWVIVCGRIFDMPDTLIMLKISTRAQKLYGASAPASGSHFDLWWTCYQSFKHCFSVAEQKLLQVEAHEQSPPNSPRRQNIAYCKLLVKAVDTCMVRRTVKTCVANSRPVEDIRQNKYELACQSYQLLREVGPSRRYCPRITSFILFNIVEVLLTHLKRTQSMDADVVDAINWCLLLRRDDVGMFSFDFDVTQICDDFNQEMVAKGLTPPLVVAVGEGPASPVSNLSLSPTSPKEEMTNVDAVFYTYDVKTEVAFPILEPSLVSNMVPQLGQIPPPLPYTDTDVFPMGAHMQDRFYL